MKKIFRFSAIVAILSMLTTVSVATSCSDDDDDDNPGVVDTTASNKEVESSDDDDPTTPTEQQEEKYTQVFTVKVGGSMSSASSFISVMDGQVYKTVDLYDPTKGGHVEIVYDGFRFFGARESVNDVVHQNGCDALVSVVENGKLYRFTTSGGMSGKNYTGVIEVVEGEVGNSETVITIKVSAKQS